MAVVVAVIEMRSSFPGINWDSHQAHSLTADHEFLFTVLRICRD